MSASVPIGSYAFPVLTVIVTADPRSTGVPGAGVWAITVPAWVVLATVFVSTTRPFRRSIWFAGSRGTPTRDGIKVGSTVDEVLTEDGFVLVVPVSRV